MALALSPCNNRTVDPIRLADVAAMHDLAATLVRKWSPGDVILLEGPLGVGKTTFVRGVLGALGWKKDVRSPTFNLLQVYDTDLPVAHADLYRVATADGIGLESYLETHILLVEWPDRFTSIDPTQCWRIEFRFESADSDARIGTVEPPSVLG